jgi:hypothetical protein
MLRKSVRHENVLIPFSRSLFPLDLGELLLDEIDHGTACIIAPRRNRFLSSFAAVIFFLIPS